MAEQACTQPSVSIVSWTDGDTPRPPGDTLASQLLTSDAIHRTWTSAQAQPYRTDRFECWVADTTSVANSERYCAPYWARRSNDMRSEGETNNNRQHIIVQPNSCRLRKYSNSK